MTWRSGAANDKREKPSPGGDSPFLDRLRHHAESYSVFAPRDEIVDQVGATGAGRVEYYDHQCLVRAAGLQRVVLEKYVELATRVLS